MSVLKTLRAISKEANQKVENINFGGCGVMAYLVTEELVKRGIAAEGITTYGNPAKVYKQNPNIKKWDGWDWQRNGVYFSHMAVRFRFGSRTYTYDTNRIHRSSKNFGHRDTTDTKFNEGIKSCDLKKIAATRDGFWNDEFNRKDIPKLKKIVKKHFKAFDEKENG